MPRAVSKNADRLGGDAEPLDQQRVKSSRS
jgi:hypothetical protein